MHSHPNAADIPALVAKLCDAGIEFIIVGGAAAVLQGAPITTFDLDIVHRRTPENVARLLELLQQLDATMRCDLAPRGLRPTAEMLLGKGQIKLSTSLGPFDPLCELDAGRGYDELLAHARSVVDEGRTLRVLDLPTLIAVKTKAGRPKDRMAERRPSTRARLRPFICPRSPRNVMPRGWREFHDRLLLNTCPPGYFSVFREMSDFLSWAPRRGEIFRVRSRVGCSG